MTEEIELTQLPNSPHTKPGRAKRMMFLLPVAVFLGVAVAFAIGLTLNPRDLPSVLIGKPVPNFDLPPVLGRKLGLSSDDLSGEISLVNVFASWCTACKTEHPILMRFASANTIPIHGLNYKDKPEDARNWLDELGDPYTRTGADLDGRVAIDWGVYGVPETYVIDRSGKIAFKQIGPITPEILNSEILPLINRLNKNSP